MIKFALNVWDVLAIALFMVSLLSSYVSHPAPIKFTEILMFGGILVSGILCGIDAFKYMGTNEPIEDKEIKNETVENEKK